MPGDFTYFRKFVILKDDYTNIEGLSPKGHGRIEVKGNKGLLRLKLENCEAEEQYNVYFLMEKDGEVQELNIGKIFTDERGRGREEIAINLKDIEQKGFPMDRLDGLLLRRDGHILLAGYINKASKVLEKYVEAILSVDTKTEEKEELDQALEIEEQLEEVEDSKKDKELSQYFPMGFFPQTPQSEPYEEVVEEKGEKDIEEVAEKAEEKAEGEVDKQLEEVEEEVEEAVKEVEDKKEYDIQEDKLKAEEKVEEDISRLEERDQGLVEDMEIEDERASYQFQEAYKYHTHTYDQIEYIRRLNHKKQMTEYILSVLKYFPQVQPFKIYLHGYTWWRIDDNGSGSYRGFLPYYNYLLSANYKYPFMYNATTCLEQIKKYGHYLFGIYSEGNQAKYYVYAIPGKFTTEEHPFKGITGFNTWYDSIDGVGYWILYIDPLTGKVIYPINPMIPVE